MTHATHYVRSNGERREIKVMAYPHMLSALAVLEGKQPHRTAEIAGLKAEIAKREEAEQ